MHDYEWHKVAATERRIVALKPVRRAIRTTYQVSDGVVLEDLVAAAASVLAEELQRLCTDSPLFTVKALAVKESVLVQVKAKPRHTPPRTQPISGDLACTTPECSQACCRSYQVQLQRVPRLRQGNQGAPLQAQVTGPRLEQLRPPALDKQRRGRGQRVGCGQGLHTEWV